MEDEVTTLTMATLLSTIGDVFSAAIGWVLGFVGVGVGLFRRMFNV